MKVITDQHQLIDALAAWLLNRDDRLDLDNEFGVNMIQGGGSQKHDGDCTKQSHSCLRCIADEATADANALLSAISAAGLSVVRGFDTSTAPHPAVRDCYPLVLYFASKADAKEFTEIVMEAKPGMVAYEVNHG